MKLLYAMVLMIASGFPLLVHAYDWTGFYAGINAGYAISDKDVRITGDNSPGGTQAAQAAGSIPTKVDVDDDGFIGGIQVGYNWQAETYVWGLEADIAYVDIGETTAVPNNDAGWIVTQTTVSRDLDWLATIRGRAGKLLSPDLLAYATAGVAFGDATQSVSVGTTDVGTSFSSADELIGWTLGVGSEWSLTNNITLKGEYLYFNLDIHMPEAHMPGANQVYQQANTDFEGHIVRIGLNMKF